MGALIRVAGSLGLAEIMASLSRDRPVFDSEADAQLAFEQAIADTDRAVQVRLEVRQSVDRAE